MIAARLPLLAAVLFWTLASLPSPATAGSKLPWKDANPVEGLSAGTGKAGGGSKAKAIPAAVLAPAAPPVDAVPVPDRRPAAPGDEGEDAGKPKTDDAKPAEPGPLTTEPAIPEARPEPAETSGDAISQGGAALVKALPEAPVGAAVETVVTSPPADGGEAANKPVSEIPLPEGRPAPPEPSPSKTKAPASPDADPSTPQQADEETDDAPNSTEKLKSRTTTITPAASVSAAAAVSDAELCEAELSRRGVAFTVGNSISEGECGVLRPVNVTKLSSGIKVSPRTQLLCRTVLALDDWMKDGVVPAARTTLPAETLTEFRNASTYVCRPRASEAGISEHARGSAIDIAAFVFASGKEIGIAAQKAGSPKESFEAKVRAKACGPFTTVLGPGTDADHATHFHLDIAARAKGATYCK